MKKKTFFILCFLFLHFLSSSSLLCAPTSSITSVSILPSEDVTEKEANDTTLDAKPVEIVYTEGYWGKMFNILCSLLIVLAIFIAVAWMIRKLLHSRFERYNQVALIKILEKRALSPKSALYLIEIKDQLFLIGETSSAGIRPIGQIQSSEGTSFPLN